MCKTTSVIHCVAWVLLWLLSFIPTTSAIIYPGSVPPPPKINATPTPTPQPARAPTRAPEVKPTGAPNQPLPATAPCRKPATGNI